MCRERPHVASRWPSREPAPRPQVLTGTILDLTVSVTPLQVALHGLEVNILAELGKCKVLTRVFQL